MLKLGKTKRAIAMSAAALALAGGATIGLSSAANAAAYGPPPSTTDWFSLYLMNDSGGRTFLVCNEQSGPDTVGVSVIDSNWHNLVLQDVNSGWEFTKANIRFNSGGCEEFNVIGSYGSQLQGVITTPNVYDTGWVTFN